jgi:uncharacterized lipoprotein YddW (UPF0748 family)
LLHHRDHRGHRDNFSKIHSKRLCALRDLCGEFRVQTLAWSVGALALLVALPLAAQHKTSEVRALWVQRGSLTSSRSVLSLVEIAKENGFNTLIVQVRGRADAYYNSRLEPRAAALSKQPPSFDPLQLLVATAHRAGLRVHAWTNVNLVSDAELPSDQRHVVRARPEWLMVPRELAAALLEIEPRHSQYVEALSHYARTHSDRIEGIYLSPLHPAAADHTVKVISDIAGRYAVDGIHLDYARFPNPEFDYSRTALSEFRSYILPRLSRDERQQYDARAGDEPFFYTDMFPQRWHEFRRQRLTTLVKRVARAVKDKRRAAVVTAAVLPDPIDASTHRLQDWSIWLETGLLDAVCPMVYTTDTALFRSQIRVIEQLAGRRPVWAGIGAFRLPSSQTIDNIRSARQLGTEGVILFSYDNLDSDYLSAVAHGAFGQ